MVKVVQRRKRGRPAADESDSVDRKKKQEYQHDYYLAHREKAIQYQRDYATANRKFIVNARKRQEYVLKYARTGKDFERDAVRTVHNANSLQAIPVGGRLERELNRVLSGQCDYAGCR